VNKIVNLIVRFKNAYDKSIMAKIILFIIVIFLLFKLFLVPFIYFSFSQKMINVIDAPIRDEEVRERIVQRINQEGIDTMITPEGLIKVKDFNTARKTRAIIIREDLLPVGKDVLDSPDSETWKEDIQNYYQKNSGWLGITLIAVGIYIFMHTVFTLIFGEKLGKIVTSIISVLLGIILILPVV
jgi:hypothetical protein